MLGYAEIIAIIGFSAVILQASIIAFAPVSYALLSPIHACCCLLLLGSLHPFLQRALRRRAEYGGRAVTAEQLMSDPVIQAALNGPKLPAPFEHSLYALALMALADVCEGLRVVYDGRAFAVAIYDGAHELLAGSAAFTLFYGTRRLGAKPSTTLSMACFASGALAAFAPGRSGTHSRTSGRSKSPRGLIQSLGGWNRTDFCTHNGRRRYGLDGMD